MANKNQNRNNNRNNTSSSKEKEDEYTKHSGCDMRDHYMRGGKERVDLPVVWGWKWDKTNGKRKFVSVPANDSATKSDRWRKMVTTVTRADGSQFLTNTLWDVQKKRLKFTDMSMVANPYARKGGYWGPGGYDMDID